MFTRAAALGIVIAALALPCAAGALTLELNPAQIARVDAAMRDVMAREHIAGMSIALAQRGRVLYAMGYGERDAHTHAPADRGTVYEIGSLTKQFTAACVVLLVSQNKLDLEAPVSQFVNVPAQWKAVTIRQLLAQISGIPSYTDITNFATWSKIARTPAEVIGVVPRELHFAPGTQWEYSNTNYFLLGLVIERVSVTPYADFVRQQILRPLNLKATSFTGDAGVNGHRAIGTTWNGVHFEPAQSSSMSISLAAGALSSTVDDLIAWNSALLTYRVLPPKYTALMTSEGVLANQTGTAYGMGFMLAKIYGRNVVLHTGAIDGFSASAGSVEPDGLQFVILTNTEGIDTLPIAKTLIAIADPPDTTH